MLLSLSMPLCPAVLIAEEPATAAATVTAGSLTLAQDQAGRIVRVRCGADDVTGRAIASSGFALRDCAAQGMYEPISGRVTTAEAGLKFQGRGSTGTLAVTANCVAENDWLAVRGEVQNLDGRDHAVSLRFALPVACEGWKWATRLHKTEPLMAGREVHFGIPTRTGTGHIALRPMAAVSNARHTLGLAMPADFIGLYDFSVDVDQGLFAVVIDFAMTQQCPRFSKRVPFEFYVVGKADGWGLRSVLASYYANRPELFKRHTGDAGGWFAWGDILRQPPPICDYGLMFHEQPESDEAYAHDKELGIHVYPYIEPFMYQMCLGDQPEDRRPTRELVLRRLEQWADPQATGRLTSGGWETEAAVQGICRALLKYGPRDTEGSTVIGAIGQWPWIRGTHWGAQFPLDLTPAVPGGAGQDRLAYVRSRLLNRPHLDGIYLDSMANHLSRIDFAEDKFRYLTYPPLFDSESFRPCTIVGLAAWEWVEALWRMLPADKKELLPNLYGQQTPLPWHRFTLMGKEHWIEPTGPLMQQYRTMAYRKVVTQLPAYEDRDERFLRNLVLLDVFPGGYARHSTDPPQGMRASYRRVIPLLRQLHRLGWEPITNAVSTTSGIRIERYGRAPGPIALAVHNPFEADVVNFEVDAQKLSLPKDAYVVDAIDGSAVEYSHQGQMFHLAVGVGGNNTTLLVVGNNQAHSRWLRMLADDRLDDVRLCLKEHALRRQIDVHPAWVAAAELTSSSSEEQLLNVSRTIAGDSPTETRARELLDLAASHIQAARNPQVPPSQTPKRPRADAVSALDETFDELSAERWQPSAVDGIRAANGRLEMELPRDATTAEIHFTQSWPFVPHPLIIETDFKFTHGDHDRYLRLSLKVSGAPSGPGDYLLLRMDASRNDRGQLRVENHNAPATQWKHTLSKWHEVTMDKPHHLRLRLDRDTFRLEVDGRLVGEGPHECSFGWAYLTLGVYSGHRGHGDVCWWDNLKVYKANP